MLAVDVGASVALEDILTRTDRLYVVAMWGVVAMNRLVATRVVQLRMARTRPMRTAMMIGDIKHQSRGVGKRNLFQLSLRIS